MSYRNTPPDLPLTLWREACRHIDIGEFLANVATPLRASLPIVGVAVRELDATTGKVITLADTWGRQGESQHVGENEMRRLRAWAETAGLVTAKQLRAQEPSLLRLLGATQPERTLYGALTGEHDTRGVLIIELAPGAQLGAALRQQLQDLVEAVSAALDNHHRLHGLAAQREAAEASRQHLALRLGRDPEAEPVIGADGGLRGVIERVNLVRGSDVPVLILGETGAGKELVAREIHNGSRRMRGPFLRVNCGAIPTELIDSELFGHEKGSFTGASAQRQGWFERADEGTLFLDEIGELPLAAQVRLLRVLQDGQVQRVGGESSVPVNVRIVAATHRDLPTMVQDGRFRADLWYRIATFPIVLPPLRERLQDIPELTRHFAERAAARFGLRPQVPSAEALVLLSHYSWPGNVRELQAVVDRAAILGNGVTLEIAKALGMPGTGDTAGGAPTMQLPTLGVHGPASSTHHRVIGAHDTLSLPGTASAPSTNINSVSNNPVEQAVDRLPTLDEAMRAHIARALQRTAGRIEGKRGAAALLDINPHTLRARMRKLGLGRNDPLEH